MLLEQTVKSLYNSDQLKTNDDQGQKDSIEQKFWQKYSIA